MTGRSSQGCRFPSGAEVEAHLRAGAPWTMSRDIPDVDGWKDFVAAPEAVHECLKRRIADGRCPMPPSVVSLPKLGSDELRKVTYMDPYDELRARILLGGMVDQIEASLHGNAEVLSYRVIDNALAWSACSLRLAWSVCSLQKAWSKFRNRSIELLNEASCNAMGTFDIRHYYPSIAPDMVASMLTSVGVPEDKVNLLEQFLSDLTKMGGPPGLPIGPEFSGLIGNVMLTGVDRALAPLVLSHVRVSDDSRIFVRGESAWKEAVEVYREETGNLGLSPNESKSFLYTKASGDALREIENERINYLLDYVQETIAPEVAADEIESQIKSDAPDWTVINFGLGALIRHQSMAGLSVIYENPSILYKTPTQAGKYLFTLASNGGCRKIIDQDWLVEQATSPFQDRSSVGKEIAGKIQACRVAERLGVGDRHGKLFEEVAMTNDSNRDIPLKAWTAKAWGASSAHRTATAVDHAASVGEFLLRRAFALTIKSSDSTERNRQKWYRHLSVREPDLKPTLARLR